MRMCPRPRRYLLVCTFALALALMLASPRDLTAQTGAGLVLIPWEEPTRMQIDADVRLFDDADIDDTDDELRARRFSLTGRHRLLPESREDDVRLGYDVLEWKLRSSDPALPNRLVDASVAGGWTRELELGRNIGATLGAGYAGDRPFGESEALYVRGNLTLQQALDRRSRITLLLNYDGNRTIWPDLPLPGIAYSRRVDDTLSYTIGVPTASVRWTPTEQWTLTASYVPAYTVNARAEYRMHDAWHAFALFENEYHGFADGDRDRRLFLRQRRLEGGLRYEPHEQWQLTLAAGYAFDQRFERGWDARSTRTVRDVDDAPYLRAGLGFEF